MKKEVLFRITRITMVIIFVSILATIRSNVKASYDAFNEVKKEMPKFVVTSLSNSIYSNNGITEEYSVKIKNITNKKRNVSFVLKDVNQNYPYNYVAYTIIKDNKIVKKSIVKKDGYLYNDVLSSSEDNSYKIIFTISKELINSLQNVSTSAKISFV